MKNYPEYPDSEDVCIKDLAEEHGIKDFKRAKKIFDLCSGLQMYAIQDRKFVIAVLRWRLGNVKTV